MTPPLVSIIIPAFNRETLIRDTLDAVRQQTYENFECIVVDDGSADLTPDVVKRYHEQDPRFRLLHRDRLPKGASVCRNIGLEHAGGDYIVFLDSDDVLAETCLENRLAVVARHPGVDFWVFPTGVFARTPGDTTKVWNALHKNTPDLIRFLLQDMPWHIAGPIWRREAVARLQGFNGEALCWQDWEFHLRALLAGLTYHKTTGGPVDSYYRKDIQSRQNTISGAHHDRRHVLYRIGLIDRFYGVHFNMRRLNSDPMTRSHRITIQTPHVEMHRPASTIHSKKIRFAFSVLYYRLLVDLAGHALEAEMLALLRRLKPEGLFSPPEHVALTILAKNIGNPRLQWVKNQATKLALAVFNPKKFYNRSNSTFLATPAHAPDDFEPN